MTIRAAVGPEARRPRNAAALIGAIVCVLLGACAGRPGHDVLKPIGAVDVAKKVTV